jgi:tetratricopeptide (TPR) repeat protein
MSLFSALSELIGGAALAASPACDLALPAETLAERRLFVDWLAVRDEIRDLRTVVEAVGRDIWTANETRGLAQGDLEAHVLATGEILSEHPPAAALLAEVAAKLKQTAPGQTHGGESVARRIAHDLVGRARAAGRLTALGVSDDVVLFLVERSFSHLAGDMKALLRLGPALADYAAERGGRRDKGAKVSGLATLGISRALEQRIEQAGGLAYLAELGQRHGLSERAMRRLVALVDSQTSAGDERILRLEHLAQWLGDVRAQLLKPANDDVEVRRLKSVAAAALAEGDFEGAMDAMRQVRRELRESRRRTEERLQEEAIALKAQMLEEARATARLAELLAARGEHAQAAELFSEAAIALPRSDRDAAWRFNLQRAESLLQHARQRGESGALSEAISAYGQLVRQAAESTNTTALAEACLGHGEALTVAGERETGTGRLKDAVTIFQKAIQLLERERDQSSMVKARLALARALARLGERDGSTDVLRKAAQAFRDAAGAVSPEKLPGEHAQLKMGLGSVLLAIEEREGGKPLLTEAADAYRAALSVLDPEAEMERFAEAQLNLGLALLGLGEQEGSSAQLEEAVAAFRAAIESTPRVRVPQRWALAQMNLGNALAALGDRDPTGTTLLEEAIGAYHLALEELVRDREPLKWAITQMNLGTALTRMGERKERRRHWLAAASALVPALEVFEAERADAFADMTRRSLKRFQDSWDSFIGLPSAKKDEAAHAAPAPARVAKTG